uniref:SKP1-like protein 1A n=1 Tax=Erigeron canadensis TaxID=72917 RepID=UPI001CB9AC69|nr:SKP1-like protein 1A [Erigeron canadensis]
MPSKFHHLNSFLFVMTSISIFTVSSRPITTTLDDHEVLATPSVNNLVLTTSDGEKFDVKLQAAMQSETIRQIIAEKGFSNGMVIDFYNITGETMRKVLEYCNKHVYHYSINEEGNKNITALLEMKAFDTEFVNVHYETLFKLFLAANDLKIKDLKDLVGGRIGEMMKGKTPEQIRKMFNINEKSSCVDYAAEEKFVQSNAWAFD